MEEDREGLNKKERDLNMNLASPSNVVIELLLVGGVFPDPATLLSFEELVRRLVEETYK